MNDQTKEQKAAPPYVAYKTFKNFIRSLKAAIPSRIDKSVMPSMAGGAQSQVVAALKYLDLTDAAGVPQQALVRLAKSEGAEYENTLLEVLKAHYPFLAYGLIDLETATMHQLEEQFERLATGDTVRKCMTFFIPAAKDAGMKLSPYIKEPGKRSASNGKARKQRAVKPQDVLANPPPGHPLPSNIPLPSVVSWHEMLLAKFPSFDPAWPDDVKAKWFASFAELMQKGSSK